jgi:hypothetical protein
MAAKGHKRLKKKINHLAWSVAARDLMRRVLLVLVGVTAVLGAGWYGLHFVPADSIYEVETEFAGVPRDDHELEGWVRAQPGVWKANVARGESEKRTRLTLIVGITQNGWGRPPIPDLEGKCTELGYRGQSGPFRDMLK